MSTQVPTQVSGEVAEQVAAAAISLVKSVGQCAIQFKFGAQR